jgi:peptide/nickel transport system substrate-binding protein
MRRHLLCLLPLTLLAACAAPAETPSSAPVILRIGWAGSPDSLNLGVGVTEEAYDIYELVYNSMFNLQLDGSYTPELAETVETSADGLLWTFHLRPGITWHDGQPLTAGDVAFTYNFYAAHEEFPYMPAYTGYFESVTAADDQTVEIRLTEPIPNMESQLYFLYVLPEHIWAEHDNAAAAEFENREMVGTGPFRLVDYAPGEFVHLAAVKDHFLNPPTVDEVIFQTFESQDALVQAIRTGQVDMITEMPNTAVESLRQVENVEVVTGVSLDPDIADIILNQVAPEDCPPEDGVCSGHPALRDRNVRQALAHATDKASLIQVVLLGLGNPGRTLIPDGLGEFYNDTIADYPFDLARANQLLEEGGYRDADGDGVRETPDGEPLVFRLNWPTDSITAPRTAELLSQSWGQAGIRLELQALDPDTLTSVCCPAFDFDVRLWGWGSDPDPGFLLSVMTAAEIPSGLSETGYSNAEYDALYDEQATELDLDRRRQIIWQMQEIVHRDVVYIVPWYAQEVQAFRTDRFQGWVTDAPRLQLKDTSSLANVEPVP